jgi:aminoglycoside phosphotransferase (APT) family kinase protein
VHDGDDLRSGLERFIRAQVPGAEAISILGLRRSPAGLSRENWPFDLTLTVDGNVRELSLILRRDPRGSVLETDRRLELAVLNLLEGSLVPAPRAYWIDESGSWLGRPAIVMERREGTCDYFVLTGGSLNLDEHTRLRLARDFCETLAALHAVDPDGDSLDSYLEPRFAELPPGALRELAYWEAYVQRQALEPQPELAAVACWLREHAPRPQRTVLVHGDFKPGNALIRDGRIDAILDWETAHRGDPMEDLGWVTNPYRSREHTIPGRWEKRDLLAHYAALTGLDVRPEEVHYWNVFTNYKLAAIVLTGVRSTAERRCDRIYSYGMFRAFAGRLFDLLEQAP